MSLVTGMRVFLGFLNRKHPSLLHFSSLDDAQKQKELSKKENQKILEEKQQVMSDLNSMEKSFSELFKRFEKQKEALEGYRKVR